MNREEVQKEILDIIPSYGRGRLLVSPRVGKTPIIISLFKRDKPKSILWVTPSSELAESVIPSEFKKFKATRFLKYLKTCTWKSLNKYQGEYDYIILDEEQYLTLNNLKSILNNTLRSKGLLSMSGTPTKSWNKNLILNNQLKLPILYNLSIDEAVNLNLLSNYQINIIRTPLSSICNLKIESKNKTFFTSEKSQYTYLDREAERAIYENNPNKHFKILSRMRAIYENKSKYNTALKLFNDDLFKDSRKIIFCPTIQGASNICKYNYHSKTNNENLIKFCNGDINSISMVNSGGIGFTYKEVDDLFLIQVDSDVNGYTSQKICRALLKQPNHTVRIWIFLLEGTKDEGWIQSALSNFKKEKINNDYKFSNTLSI